MWPLIDGMATSRSKPIGFLNRDAKEAVWMEDRFKFVVSRERKALFDINMDPSEKRDLIQGEPSVAHRMEVALEAWKGSVLAELAAIPE